MCGSKAPPPPDYSQLAEASAESAKYAFAMSMEQLDWAKEQYASDKAIAQQVVDASLARQDLNDAAAMSDRARYEAVYQPLEDRAAADAESYASAERQEFEAGRASSEVGQQFDAARRATTQNLESYGVDPSSTRYAALDLGSRVQQAAAQAGAGNQARVQTEGLGRAMRSEAINVGRGYPGQIAGAYGTALQSGNSAVNSALGATASGANTMGTANQWAGTNNQAIGTGANVMTAGYNAALGQYSANQNSSSGIGGLAGAVLGYAGNAGMLFSEGGAVPSEATSGGSIPAEASRSRGGAIDDVDAKLTAGEFVVPKDVVSWKGEEFFQKLIDGSRKAKPNAPAQPQYAVTEQRPATFKSGAIPA